MRDLTVILDHDETRFSFDQANISFVVDDRAKNVLTISIATYTKRREILITKSEATLLADNIDNLKPRGKKFADRHSADLKFADGVIQIRYQNHGDPYEEGLSIRLAQASDDTEYGNDIYVEDRDLPALSRALRDWAAGTSKR